MSKGGKFSLLLGMATGAVTSLLFAPGKGKELRKRIVQERKSGGFGHKAVVDDLTNMAEEIGHLVGEVSKSDEARKFWLKTNEAVSELTSGSVDLDKWVKEAHTKADQFKKTVSRYAEERKGALIGAKKVAQRAQRQVKRIVKSVKKKPQIRTSSRRTKRKSSKKK